MFKKLALFLALALAFAVPAQAFTVTIDSAKNYTSEEGKSKREVVGSFAFDSDYPCNATTSRCGESLPPYQLGMSDIDYIAIEPVANGQAPSGGMIFLYSRTGTCGDGSSAGCVRGYFSNAGSAPGITQGAFISMPTYDLSALTSVPFRAVGTV